jgi:hypothetical protein
MYRFIAFFLVLIIAANTSASSGLVHFIKHEKISKAEAEQSQKQSDSQLLKEAEGEASLQDEIAFPTFASVISLFLIPSFVEENNTVSAVDSQHPFAVHAPLFLRNSVFRI